GAERALGPCAPVAARRQREAVGDVALAPRRPRNVDRDDQHLAADGGEAREQVLLDALVLERVELEPGQRAGDGADLLDGGGAVSREPDGQVARRRRAGDVLRRIRPYQPGQADRRGAERGGELAAEDR